MAAEALPLVIQGGMGVGVSSWMLARAVSLQGQMGVVSGTALDTLFVRRLQDGDLGGHLRRAMERFPIPEVSADVLTRYFRPDGRNGEPYRPVPMYKQVVTTVRHQLTMLANFVEVYLAKEGHDNPVGINLLTKVQMPNLGSLYGAMLAGVDYVLMGAGIPREIPGALDKLAQHEPASIRFDVEGLTRDEVEYLIFDPREHGPPSAAPLKRPMFLPIIASNSLATMLLRKATGRIDGFVIEGPTAGGHNAPPRGGTHLNERGEPIYGERDLVDLDRMAELGVPFWIAGGAGAPDRLDAALASGAAGIQVGTLFAYCDESGLTAEVKRRVLEKVVDGDIDVLTDARASPTGFPFKVVQLEGTGSALPVYQARERVCDLGYLRNAYKDERGRIGYRCAAEPVDTFVKKGGELEETLGRKCLCNALLADIGHGQVRDGGVVEPPLLTSGDDLREMNRFLRGRTRYSASDVLDYLLTNQRASISTNSHGEADSDTAGR